MMNFTKKDVTLSLFVKIFIFQMLSIEDVEKIMDETQEGVEYQRVRKKIVIHVNVLSVIKMKNLSKYIVINLFVLHSCVSNFSEVKIHQTVLSSLIFTC